MSTLKASAVAHPKVVGVCALISPEKRRDTQPKLNFIQTIESIPQNGEVWFGKFPETYSINLHNNPVITAACLFRT
jgi:hypothetical protein